MMNSKIMSGKDVVSRLSFEQYFADCKSVLVICDLWAEICGAKTKIKKAFSKDTKVAFVKFNTADFAEVSTLDSCLQKFKEVQADMVVCAGSQVACNLGKAVKYISTFGAGSFEDFCKIKEQNNDCVVADNVAAVKLVHLVTASGDHAPILTGAFEIFDKKANVFYRFDKKIATPDIVMVDEKLLDKVSLVGILGIEIGVLAMSLIVLTQSTDELEKLSARTAINLIGGETPPSSSDLFVAEMSAGYSFLGIKNNLLQEVVFGIQTKTNLLYFQVLILLLKSSFSKLVGLLAEDEIKLLGTTYNIELTDDYENFKKQFCSVIDSKIAKYFEDKDVIRNLNEAGLNSDMIEDIFTELEGNFGQSDILSALKDLTYAGY